MFFNRKKEKRNIINEAVLDLRNATPQALENVKIINAACVLLPENLDEALMTAYGNIKIKNIATTLTLPSDKIIANFNGTTVLTESNYTPNAIHFFNGTSVIEKIEKAEPIEILANGIMIYSLNTKIHPYMVNGISVKAPFDISGEQIFACDAKIDGLFIENVKDNTVVLAGKNIILCKDVTLELLKSKNIYFVAGQNIKCSWNILGYLQTIATAGSKIEVNE